MMTYEAVSPTLQRPVTVKAFGITDNGKVRPNNEDQFLIAEADSETAGAASLPRTSTLNAPKPLPCARMCSIGQRASSGRPHTEGYVE
jgi:hypothetical protein